LVCSCASIVSGSRDKVRFITEPEGATVTIFDENNMKVWSSDTPTSVSLKRGDGYFSGAYYRVEIEMPGFKKENLIIDSQLNAGWYIVGNLVIGTLLGWFIIDPLTGAMWSLDPNVISIQLKEDYSHNTSGIYEPVYLTDYMEQIQEQQMQINIMNDEE
jgi:hypothetical protein